MTPDPDGLLDFARRYAEAWCSQDPASVAEHYAPDGSLTINGGSPSVGRGAITKAARSFMTAFPDMQVQMDDLPTREAASSFTGPWSEPIPGRAEQEIAFGSQVSRSGRSVGAGSSPRRKATTISRSTIARSSAA
jgi:SnoaL-like domain